MSFICGSFRSPEEEEDNYDVLWPFSSPSTRKSTRINRHIFGRRSNKNATNPYADRGLDKFQALLAELDQKRRNILAQKGFEDVSMVRFIYSSNNEIEPVVIKLQDDQRKHHNTSSLELDHQKDYSLIKRINNEAEEKNTKVKPSVDERERTIWKTCYYFPLFVILILVLLMFSGRFFAIFCTSVGWYLVPVVKEKLHDTKQPNKIKKKE